MKFTGNILLLYAILMRHFTVIILISLGILSCKQKVKEVTMPRPDYLSVWFLQNKDSLFNEFNQQVQTELFSKNHDTNWGEYAFQNGDSSKFMGRFTLEAKKYCDSLDVTFFYNKSTDPHMRILLSTNFNRKYIKAIDSIFAPIPKSNYFIIDKYEQPDTSADIFSINNINAIVKELRIQLTPIDHLTNLIVYIKAIPKKTSIDEEQKEFFIHELFGEELLLKKLNIVEIKFTDSIMPNLLTLQEVRKKLR